MSSAAYAYDVFVGYSPKDKAVVHPLAQKLSSSGLRVWLDEWEIHPGESIPDRIEDGLLRSRVLVFCMSANAFGPDWTSLESQTFRFRDPLNKNRRFIPVRLDDAEPKGSLVQFSYVDWRKADDAREYARLVQACQLAAARASEPPESIIHFRSSPPVECLAFSRDIEWALSGHNDGKVRLWNTRSGQEVQPLPGHTQMVQSVAFSPDGKHALSAGKDERALLWNLESGSSVHVLMLRGHSVGKLTAAFSPDGESAICCSSSAATLWNLDTGKVSWSTAKQAAGYIGSIAFSPDGKTALLGRPGGSIAVHDVKNGRLLQELSGHTGSAMALAFSPDGRHALSGSVDKTLRLWDLDSGRSLRVLEGHTGSVSTVAFDSTGTRALSGASDYTVCLWDIESGRALRLLAESTGPVVATVFSLDGKAALAGDDCGLLYGWSLAKPKKTVLHSGVLATEKDELEYTNAKVLLVGESGSGKTGLTERLVYKRPPRRGPSTVGTWSTQWSLGDLPQEHGTEREVWLWDFGGQADQRLIHQLYLDHTALVLLMFDADRESVVFGLLEWQQALARSVARDTPTLLVAGRTDAGLRFDREKVRAFADKNNYKFFETSAETGRGIADLRTAMLESIRWHELTRHNSPALFKRLKEEILKLRDEGRALLTLKELENTLRLRLPPEVSFADVQLEAVVSLLDGPGLVKELGFGRYILLRPEWINIYAQAVIRTLRSPEYGLGFLPVSSIADGKLIFQTKQGDKKDGEEMRLPKLEEQVVLQAMEQLLLERRLCLRQNGDLVFPSHCGVERPVGPMPPHFFVSYTMNGFLDDIYATLIVKLAHCGAFRLKEFWRDAADFETLAEGKIVGIKLVRREDGQGELLAHAKGVSLQEQVIFASYIHEHLREKSTEEVPRLRFYSCPYCDEPVENRKLAMELLDRDGEDARIVCQRCVKKFVPLWDALEKKFASEAIKRKVESLRQRERNALATRQQGKLLILEVSSRIISANQKCWEVPGDQDEGVDLDVEFTDDDGNGSGKHMYLQLKAGNSFLKKRQRDNTEIFTIKKQRWVQYWVKQSGPMMLVIGTFPEDREHGLGIERKQFADVRWMEIGALLKRESDNGRKRVSQIIFTGERLDAISVRKWRKIVLEQD
jgi:small GTP-binding protein